ncbi:MAG: putative response regulator, CheY [Verrucomicrobiales bacterium]|nr:putative response regulator, CheY [Verrucomicrobiales bacterium]
MFMASCKPVVLYIEDEPTDVIFLRRALRKAGLRVDLFTVPDGVYAIDWLLGKPPFDDRRVCPMPNLIVTDLKMPVRDGFEVLDFVRSHREFRDIPILVYSTSSHDEDKARSMAMGATAYLTKTDSCAELLDVLTNCVEPVEA